MRVLIVCTSRAMTLTITLVWLSRSALSTSACAADSKDTKLDAIVRRLAEQERTVRTCECLLSYRCDPTSPEMIPLVKEELLKRRRIGGFLFTKEDAERRTYVGHWWRKGTKERFDQFPTFEELSRPGAKVSRSEAFDGTLVRRYDVRDKPNPGNGAMVEGVIRPSERLGAGSLPFEFLYESWNQPYSELVSQARDAQVAEADGRTTVMFSHPKQKAKRFKLVFGSDGSLVERDEINKFPPDVAPRIYQRVSFSDYRTYRAAGEEAIRFPSEIDCDYVLGTTDDGKLIVYEHQHIQVNSLQLNHTIPDETFVIEFPDDCVVSDQTQLFRRLKTRKTK